MRNRLSRIQEKRDLNMDFCFVLKRKNVDDLTN